MLIDSSGSRLVCALGEEGAERIVAEAPSDVLTTTPLDAVVASLLGHCTVADIYSIVVGIGPGSFIGTRTAICFANGFAAAAPTSVELCGVNSLAAIAAAHGDSNCAVLRDARRGQWYVWTPDGECVVKAEGEVAGYLQAKNIASAVLELSVEAWQAETRQAVGQGAGTAKDSVLVASSEQKVPSIIKSLPEAGITVTTAPGVIAEGLLRLALSTSHQAYIEPIYLRGFT